MTRDEAAQLVRDAIRTGGHGREGELDYYADEYVVDGQLDDVVRAVVNGLQREQDQAMPKPTRLGHADAQKRITAASERLRTLGQHAPPWRRSDNPDGSITFTAADDDHLFTITGMWAAPVADYIDAFHPNMGVGIAEIFWQLGIGKDPTATAAGLADQLLRNTPEGQ